MGETLDRLARQYSHHGYVIDKDEATEIFEHVREPNSQENILIATLKRYGEWPEEKPMVVFLSDEKKEIKDDKGTEENRGSAEKENGAADISSGAKAGAILKKLGMQG